MPDEELLFKLFEAVVAFVLSAGGDGDGWVVSEDFVALADSFDRYERKHGNWFTEKSVGMKSVCFIHGQETICFVESRDDIPEWAGDILVEL